MKLTLSFIALVVGITGSAAVDQQSAHVSEKFPLDARRVRGCLKSHVCRGIRPDGGLEFVSWQYKPTLLRWSRLFRSPAPGGGDA